MALGLIAGGLLVGLVADRFSNKIRLALFSFGAYGIATLLLGISPFFWLFLGSVAIMGITMSFINSSAITVFQTLTEPEYRGRVFSLLLTISGLTMPLSMVVFGLLADAAAVELLLMVSGLIILLTALLSLRLKVWDGQQ